MYEVILFTCDEPEISDEMINLYIHKCNVNPNFDRKEVISKLKNRSFLRHDRALVDVIKKLKCPGFKIVSLTDDEWRYYSIRDEKIILGSQ